MRELREIVAAWRAADPSDHMVLITVVDIQGSAYRRPGAHLLVVEDRSFGSISGGCLESDLVSTAWQRTESGPCTGVFDTTTQEDALWGYGLGCRGVITVFLRRVQKTDFQLRLFERHLTQRAGTAISTCISGHEIGLVKEIPLTPDVPPVQKNTCSSSEEGIFFLEFLKPVIRLCIHGAGFDAIPIASLASLLGWTVQVADHRGSMATSERFPTADEVCGSLHSSDQLENDSFAAHVVMTHQYERDKTVLRALLQHEWGYLGVLGPRSRTSQLLQDLECSFMLANVHSPAGLDLGSETPQEIALAIVSEVQAKFSSATGKSLSEVRAETPAWSGQR